MHTQEAAFIDELQRALENTLRRMRQAHRQKVATREHQFLLAKHQLLRSREAEVWEMEERHLQERHSLYTQQMKDMYYLQRAQMVKRHAQVCSRTHLARIMCL
jgi:transcriptional regulator GlxA family with amidase domain